MSEEQEKTTSLAEKAEISKDIEETPVKDSNVKAQIEEKLDTKINSYEKRPQKVDLKANLQNLHTLLNTGLLDRQQGQNLLNQIIKVALDGNTQQMSEESPQPEEKVFDKKNALKEFEKENPDFFNIDGRDEILKYLNSDEIQFDKDELSKISKIVEQVEKSAIDRYIKKVAHEENLEKSNTQAKEKLKANAQNSASEIKNFLPFTREQIGKMTSAEFLKNEKLIMEQVKKGLVK